MPTKQYAFVDGSKVAPYSETANWVIIKQYFKHPMNDNTH
jgi:hypothetical protein